MSDENAPPMGKGILHPEGMQATRDVAAGIVHEINNILGVVIGNAHLAKKNASDPAAIEKYLDEVRNAAEEGRDLMRDLGAFAGDNPIQTRFLSLNDLVRNAVSDLDIRRHARPECPRSGGPAQPLSSPGRPRQADSIHGSDEDRRIDPTRNSRGWLCGRVDDRRRWCEPE